MSGTWASGLCAQRTFCPLRLPFQRSATPLSAQAESLCSGAWRNAT
jgi:hypothetical protein